MKISVFIASVLLTVSMAHPAACAGEGAVHPGNIVFGPADNPVVFSHSAHVENFGLGCDSCHAGLFDMKEGAALAKGDFTMASLHAGQYCGACHNGSTAFATDDFGQCERCHPGYAPPHAKQKPAGPEKPISLGSGDNVAVFRHAAHAGVNCGQCHTTLFPAKVTGTVTNLDDINGGKSCGSCHNGKAAFDASDCGKCHPKM